MAAEDSVTGVGKLTSLRRRTCVSRVAGTAGSYTRQHPDRAEKHKKKRLNSEADPAHLARARHS